MASPPPNPREDEQGGSEFSEETRRDRPPAPQKTFIAPHASQLPTKLQYVTRRVSGPSTIKNVYPTVKTVRRVPTLPGKPKEATTSSPGCDRPGPAPAAPGRSTRRDRNKRHVCTTCEKRFSSPGKLSQHLLSHTGELPFSCELCDKRFNSKFKLVRHGLIHSEARAFACNICGKTFNRKDHLSNHVRIHNPVKKMYTCDRPECRKSYTSQLSYRKHAALHSAEEGNLQCKICDETFSTRQEIVYHLKVHSGSRTVKSETDKKFPCDYCDRKFFTAKDVRRHLVVHTGRRDFLCPYCPQKFGRKDHLVRHVKNAHPEKSWRSAAVGTSSEPPPEASAFEESFSDFPIEDVDFKMWNTTSPKAGTSKGRTRVPSTDIIVEMPTDLDIKVEPLEIKQEQQTSPVYEPFGPEYEVFVIPSPFPATPSNLPYIPQPLSDPEHLLNPNSVQSIYLDPGEGTSGLPSDILLLEEDEPTYGPEEGRRQRLPAFTQAFQTTQNPKPPPPPPPPH